MNRYLIELSYIGTRFRGIQKNLLKDSGHLEDPHSVEGVLETALKKLAPVNEFKIKLSSRTDAGVHALHNTVHVDLQRPSGKPYNPIKVTQGLNRTFGSEGLPIRVLNTRLVPMDFHVRLCAKSRTYLYRLGVLRREYCADPRMHPFSRFIPIDEQDRCYFVAHPRFDIETMKRVAGTFQGYHDFRTFMAIARGNQRQQDATYTLRRIEHISIEPGVSMACAFNRDLADKYYEYWDIRIKARSFLYKQVRRMVGAWIGAAEGRLSERDIYRMLTVPSQRSWCDQAVVAPAYGLFLCRVDYDPVDLEFPQDQQQNELPGSAAKKQAITAAN